MADYKIIGNNKQKGLTFRSLRRGDIFVSMDDSLFIVLNLTDNDDNAANLRTGIRAHFDDDVPVKRYKGTLVLKEEDFEG